MEVLTIITLDNDPCWSIADTKVEYFAIHHHGMKAVHELLDRSGKVPPMHVEQIDVISLKLLQAVFNRI